jgi:hypothetical protein
VAVARALLVALAEGRDEEAWARATALANDVLDDEKNVLAREVLDGGPFAMRRAGELADAVLDALGDTVAEAGAERS